MGCHGMGKEKQKAGIVPFFIVDNEPMMMFMRPSDKKYGGSKFQIAKGHIDKGENPLQAAVRECNEELGLVETNILWMEKCGQYFGNHHIYVALLGTNSPSAFIDFTKETGATTWLNEKDFLDIGRNKHKPVISECVVHFNYCLKKRG